jgi:hypothetical protein
LTVDDLLPQDLSLRFLCFPSISVQENHLKKSPGFQSWSRVAVLSLGLCLSVTSARAQTLSVQGDRFAIDGSPRFLTFITYFGAMGAPNVVADLHLIRSLGFDGVRIWPNLDTGPQLMNADGSLRPESLTQLLSILDQARLEHLVVDVSFTHEHIPGMTAATAKVGIAAAAGALLSYRNVLFDIQNERNVGDRRFMSEADVASIFAAIKAVDPARIATASMAPVSSPQDAADFTKRLGLDVTAFHEARSVDWYKLSTYQAVIGALKTNGKPAYMQEPNTTRDSAFAYPSNDRADYFLQAIANAKLAGAAAWCFHTEVGVDFRTGPPYMEDRLRAYPQVEWPFVNSVKPRVILRTSNGINYVVPQGGGGGGVRADRTIASPGSWEILGVSSVTGGPLVSGDRIAFTAADGTHYLQASNGGGASLVATSQSVGTSETFVVSRAGGGVIRHGESITLRANDTSWYVSAEGGGGGNVSVTSASAGSWETFTILFVSPHSSDVAPAATPFRSGPPRKTGQD